MQTALMLIDVQESFRHRPYWNEEELPRFLARTNALIEGCRRRGVPIVRILHADGPEVAGNPFSRTSGHVRPLQGLAGYEPAAEFVKSRHSALVGTGLPVWLHQHGIRRLMIAGIRTEQCCETTARHASDEGYEVDYVTEATLTFAMTQPDGSMLSSRELMLRTETVLTDRFATLCTVEQALERAQ
ncbi:cysteine hydrolase family protein [Caldimonas thermodepolymerans]|jgi:nicotinamidase-related amidase|uniref:cysteine hydrolase family protein n=1 Tax=Caldimonas thermodepolymerans TaxID=215580 RepID=UPI002235A045|nr:isochorismatase family protein [Caldimonas thermodepolymerans]UZG45075.1 isochorismatase family protein [Caldimonas thermodepolymerans]